MTLRTSMATALTLVALSLPLLAENFPSHPEARQIVLRGTRNARGLGGLPVKDGTFPYGKVIRSGALCFASADDAAKLLKMGVHTIIDLRLDNEIAKDGPDKAYLTKGVPQYLHWPMAGSRGPGLAAYESYMEEDGALFRDFFVLLSKKESYPVLFHCSAGKDRTGILTALLLELLGTPRPVIYDDYLYSMRITPALKVKKAWIDAVFAAVDADGGIDPFLQKRGVTEQQRESVRQILGVR
jgi:protein-tyrosine phosphatase